MNAVAYQELKLRLAPRMSGLQLMVAKESAKFLGVNVASRGLSALRAIVVARLLSPEDYGVLTVLLLVAFYLQCLDFGAGLATMREIPVLEARGRDADVLRLEREVFGWEIFVGTVTALGVFAFVVWSAQDTGAAAHLRAWMALPVYVFLELLRQILQSYLQSRREFGRLRRVMLCHAIADITAAVALAALWGLAGAAAAMAVASLVVLAYLLWDDRGRQPYRPLRIPWSTLRGLIGAGFPLLFQHVMWFNMTAVDKLVILSFIDRESLAYYAIAQTIAGSMLLVSGALNKVTGPLIVRRLAETSDPASLVGMVRRSVLVLAYGLLVVVATIWLCGPTFFALALPRYVQAVPLLDVTSLSMYAIGVTFGVMSLYLALGRQMLQGYMLVGAITITAATSVVLIILGFGVLGVAVASLIASAGYLAIFVGVGLRMLGQSGTSVARDLAAMLLPLVVGAGFLLLVNLGPGVLGIPRNWLASGVLATTVVLSCGGVWMALGGGPFRTRARAS